MREQTKAIFRIIDANINRAKEGLRVCEEITRFLMNSRELTARLKKIRHGLNGLSDCLASKENLFSGRQVLSDIGSKIYINELDRANLKDIFFANIQRCKESVRVLEEFSKIKDKLCAVKFKKIRYELYELEKKISQKISRSI